MNRTELLQLARAGAAARLEDLRNEIHSILKRFPELRRSTRVVRGCNGGAAGASQKLRRKLSASAPRSIRAFTIMIMRLRRSRNCGHTYP
jgi:hypothetical protein